MELLSNLQTFVLDENQSSVGTVGALNTAYSDFKNALDLISKKDNTYKNVSKGISDNKDNAEDSLVDGLIIVGSAMSVYGRKIKDENLKALCKVTESGLKRMRDTELLQKAKEIQSHLTKHQADLAEYGIGDPLATEYTNRVTGYESALSSQDTKGATSKAARDELHEAFSNADDILNEELDPMMELVKTGDSEFYNKYYAGRVIKDL